MATERMGRAMALDNTGLHRAYAFFTGRPDARLPKTDGAASAPILGSGDRYVGTSQQDLEGYLAQLEGRTSPTDKGCDNCPRPAPSIQHRGAPNLPGGVPTQVPGAPPYAPAPAPYQPAPQPYAPAPYQPAPQPLVTQVPSFLQPGAQPFAPAPQPFAPAPQPYAPAPQPYAPAPQPFAPAPGMPDAATMAMLIQVQQQILLQLQTLGLEVRRLAAMPQVAPPLPAPIPPLPPVAPLPPLPPPTPLPVPEPVPPPYTPPPFKPQPQPRPYCPPRRRG